MRAWTALAAAFVVCAIVSAPVLAKHHHKGGLGPKAELGSNFCEWYLLSPDDYANDQRCTSSVHDTQVFAGNTTIQLDVLDQKKFKGYEFHDGYDPCFSARRASLYRNGSLVQTVTSDDSGHIVFYTQADSNGNNQPWPLGSYRAVLAPVKRKAEINQAKFAGQPFAPVRKLKVTCGGTSRGIGSPVWYCLSPTGPPYSIRVSATGPCSAGEEQL